MSKNETSAKLPHQSRSAQQWGEVAAAIAGKLKGPTTVYAEDATTGIDSIKVRPPIEAVRVERELQKLEGQGLRTVTLRTQSAERTDVKIKPRRWLGIGAIVGATVWVQGDAQKADNAIATLRDTAPDGAEQVPRSKMGIVIGVLGTALVTAVVTAVNVSGAAGIMLGLLLSVGGVAIAGVIHDRREQKRHAEGAGIGVRRNEARQTSEQQT